MIKRALSREEIHIMAPQSINIRLPLRGKDYVNIPIFHGGTSVFLCYPGTPDRHLVKFEEQPGFQRHIGCILITPFLFCWRYFSSFGEVW